MKTFSYNSSRNLFYGNGLVSFKIGIVIIVLELLIFIPYQIKWGEIGDYNTRKVVHFKSYSILEEPSTYGNGPETNAKAILMHNGCAYDVEIGRYNYLLIRDAGGKSVEIDLFKSRSELAGENESSPALPPNEVHPLGTLYHVLSIILMIVFMIGVVITYIIIPITYMESEPSGNKLSTYIASIVVVVIFSIVELIYII
jgi:hypothetical protein